MMSHSGPRMTILHSEGGHCKRFLGEPDHQPREPPRRAFGGLSLVRQLERKKEMRPCPSDLERFVQRTTLMKDWPVFNDYRGPIILGHRFETTWPNCATIHPGASL